MSKLTPVDTATGAKQMTQTVFNRIGTRTANPPTCMVCRQLIRVDQWYFTRPSAYGSKHRHVECLRFH